jgi:hypothetical protein
VGRQRSSTREEAETAVMAMEGWEADQKRLERMMNERV